MSYWEKFRFRVLADDEIPEDLRGSLRPARVAMRAVSMAGTRTTRSRSCGGRPLTDAFGPGTLRPCPTASTPTASPSAPRSPTGSRVHGRRRPDGRALLPHRSRRPGAGRRGPVRGLRRGARRPRLDLPRERPPVTPEACRTHLEGLAATADPFHHTITDLATGGPVGTAALMRIDPPQRRDRDRLDQQLAAAAADRRLDRGDVPVHARARSTSWATGDTSGSATRGTRRRARRPPAWGSSSRGSSARRPSPRAAAATPRGSRSSTASGRRSAGASRRGCGPENFDAEGRQVERARRLHRALARLSLRPAAAGPERADADAGSGPGELAEDRLERDDGLEPVGPELDLDVRHPELAVAAQGGGELGRRARASSRSSAGRPPASASGPGPPPTGASVAGSRPTAAQRGIDPGDDRRELLGRDHAGVPLVGELGGQPQHPRRRASRS